MSRKSSPTITLKSQGKKSKQKKFPKFRLLLDTEFAKPSTFKKLQKKASIKHVRHNFNLPRQAEDEEIYNIAKKEELFVVTMNFKHFKKLVRRNSPGVFSLDSGLSNEQIDTILSNFVSGKNPNNYYGKAVKIK